VFRIQVPMISSGEIVGKVVVEQLFDTLIKTHADATELGETGEIALCTLRGNHLHCFPQRLTPRVFTVPYAKQLPMSPALEGRTGLMQTRDYRNQQVISAHSPVGESGLGMVAKMDTVEMYQPIRRQFGVASLLLAATCAAGALLLYWKLTPLVRELDRSREAIRADGVEALRASEARYRELFESNPHPMWVFDAETLEFLAINDAAVAHYGYSREEFLGMTAKDIRAPEEVPRLLNAIAAIKRGEAVTGVWQHRKKNGEAILVEVSPRALMFDGRNAIMLLVQDVTARIHAQNALIEETDKFRALTEQSLAGIYMIDNGLITYMNPRAAEIFGYRVDEVAGRPVRDFVIEEDWPLLESKMRERLSREVASAQYQIRARRKDGTVAIVGVHGTTANIDGKRIIVGMAQDITDKVHIEETIRDYTLRLEHAVIGTVDAVSLMVELRDPYTAGHERRVGELAAAIAAEMGLDTFVQRGLRIAGALHDVGKIVVPAEILSKPGRLVPAEFELIKGHAQQGYEILKGVDFPWPVAEVARQHHERMDGSGYPRGLKGEEIILEARILAVADVVESMGSHRPYRPTLGVEKALDEIERNGGRFYDPHVTAACLRLFREKNYSIPA
jgi:PAS domain S-box-containing protein/putative nucleotidyltransferase with HDIG domain